MTYAGVQARGAAQAFADVDRVKRQLEAIDGKTYTSYVGVVTTGSAQVREHGGPVEAGMPYIVGEKGPELMVPGSSGSIVNNDQLGRMSAAGGNVYNFNFAGHLVSDRDLGTLVQRAMLELQRVSATPVLPGVSG